MQKNNDLYILVSEKDISFFIQNYRFFIENLKSKNINVICKNTLKIYFDKIPEIVFINEDEIFKGLNFNKIKQYLIQKINNDRRAGWYLQQFIKIALCKYVKSEYYTVFDGDTLPLNKISLFDKKTNLPVFSISKEYHQPYFKTLKKLFGGKVKKKISGSFINEYMVFKTKIVKKMLNDISSINNPKEKDFFIFILDSIDIYDLNKSGFSEFETYGSYVKTFFPNLYLYKNAKSLREGIKYLGDCPNKQLIHWASKSYDIISIERSDKISRFSYIIKYNIVRKIFPLSFFVLTRNFLRWTFNKIINLIF